MALTLKNAEVERLATEIADLTGTSKTEAVRRSLTEFREHLDRDRHEPAERAARVIRFLEREVWPKIPADQRGRRLTKEEEDEILGYGPEGV